MANGKAAAKQRANVEAAKRRMTAVYLTAVERTLEIAQTPRGAGGNMRVDTGFLRASLVVQIGEGSAQQTTKPDGDQSHTWDPGAVNLVLVSADYRSTITAVWTANYARPREYGSHGQAGDGYRRLAVQRWPQTVNQIVQELKASKR